MQAINTLPKVLRRNNHQFRDKIALREKTKGYWKSYTWAEYYRKVKHLTLGLVSLGLQPGDKACLIGETKPQIFWALSLCGSMRVVEMKRGRMKSSTTSSCGTGNTRSGLMTMGSRWAWKTTGGRRARGQISRKYTRQSITRASVCRVTSVAGLVHLRKQRKLTD